MSKVPLRRSAWHFYRYYSSVSPALKWVLLWNISLHALKSRGMPMISWLCCSISTVALEVTPHSSTDVPVRSFQLTCGSQSHSRSSPGHTHQWMHVMMHFTDLWPQVQELLVILPSSIKNVSTKQQSGTVFIFTPYPVCQYSVVSSNLKKWSWSE